MTSLIKQLLIIRGPVGAGKTSVVEALRTAMSDVSIIDFDAFKRQIDNAQSSEWRRRIAFDTALYLCQKLMDEGRTIIVDIHSCFADQLNSYIELAKKNGYKASSYLIYPPLEVCLSRANQRDIPDITYEIDSDMIERYWNKTFFVESEPVYDNPNMSAADIAKAITTSVQPPLL